RRYRPPGPPLDLLNYRSTRNTRIDRFRFGPETRFSWAVQRYTVNRRALVIASRAVLLMLLVAALAVLGLGLAAVLLGGGPETEGWLRTIFGKVFAVIAAAMAAILGIPAAIGLWAMAGATAEDAVPALPARARQALVAVGIVTVAVTAVVLLMTGSAARILNLGLLGLVALATVGLVRPRRVSARPLRRSRA